MSKENALNDGVKNAQDKQNLKETKKKFPAGAKKPKSK